MWHKKCCKNTIIKQCDLPYTITKSGCYKLCGNLVFSPKEDSIAAITIASNNVDLDFSCFSLSQDVNSLTSDNNGVSILSDIENVRIHSGLISGMSASSIKGSDGLNNLTVENMSLQGLLSGSRLSVETVSAGISVVASQQNHSTVIKVDNVSVFDFNVSNRTIPDQGCFGFNFVYCDNINVLNSRVYDMTFTGLVLSVLPPVGAIVGYYFYTCSNIVVDSCLIENCSSLAQDQNGLAVSDVQGFIFTFGSSLIKVNNCTVSNLLGTRRSTGFLVATNTTDVVFTNNNVKKNLLVNPDAPGSQSRFGYEFIAAFGTPSKILVKNCHAYNGQNGFVFNGAQDVLVQECTAIAYDNKSSTTLSNGFTIRGTAKNITIEDCIADGYQGSQSTAPGVLLPSNGIGFHIRPTGSAIAAPGLAINCRRNKAFRCNGGIVTQVGINNGDCVIDSNEVAFNTIIGIENTTFPLPINPPLTKDLIIRNLAYSNGILVTPSYPMGSQYAINTGNVINQVLIQGSQSATFPSGSNLSNYDLRP